MTEDLESGKQDVLSACEARKQWGSLQHKDYQGGGKRKERTECTKD